MAHIIPPPVSSVILSDESPHRRMRVRLFQISMSAFALVATGWFFTMGIVPGMIALFITKHFLVAVLAVGLRLPPPLPPTVPPSPSV